MTVEEQILLNTLSEECERLHKVIENIKADIKNEIVFPSKGDICYRAGLDFALEVIILREGEALFTKGETE